MCGLKHIGVHCSGCPGSHTLRGCVDWNFIDIVKATGTAVTPCVGVWIETCKSCIYETDNRCHTLRGCVDWNRRRYAKRTDREVTPCVGVWIETFGITVPFADFEVTPCVGVWIETVCVLQDNFCGNVTPCVGVWIETNRCISISKYQMSHPAWVCGLKQTINVGDQPNNRSHPAWVCGLKPTACFWPAWYASHTLRGCVDWNNICWASASKSIVTPCVGVWIETTNSGTTSFLIKSHPAWVCGLKPVVYGSCKLLDSHTLRGCVDWNCTFISPSKRRYLSHPAWVCGLKQSPYKQK